MDQKPFAIIARLAVKLSIFTFKSLCPLHSQWLMDANFKSGLP